MSQQENRKLAVVAQAMVNQAMVNQAASRAHAQQTED